MAALRIGIVTCSDTCAEGGRLDESGQALAELSEARGWEVVSYHVCADDEEAIADSLVQMSDVDGCDVIFTTGGTGLSPRDVTPEATMSVCPRDVPGIAEHIRAESLKVTGRAMLSRAVAAQRGRTLVINLPGSEKAVREAFGFVADQLEHARDMSAGMGH